MEGRREARKPRRLHRPRIAGRAHSHRLRKLHRFLTMADQASIASVTDRVRPVAVGAPVTSVYFLGTRAAFVCGEEKVALVTQQGDIENVVVNSGGILCAA